MHSKEIGVGVGGGEDLGVGEEGITAIESR